MKWSDVEAASGMHVAAASPVGNSAVIRLLEATLADARHGLIIGVGMVLALAPEPFNSRLAVAGVLEVKQAHDALKALLLNEAQPRPGG